VKDTYWDPFWFFCEKLCDPDDDNRGCKSTFDQAFNRHMNTILRGASASNMTMGWAPKKPSPLRGDTDEPLDDVDEEHTMNTREGVIDNPPPKIGHVMENNALKDNVAVDDKHTTKNTREDVIHNQPSKTGDVNENIALSSEARIDNAPVRSLTDDLDDAVTRDTANYADEALTKGSVVKFNGKVWHIVTIYKGGDIVIGDVDSVIKRANTDVDDQEMTDQSTKLIKEADIEERLPDTDATVMQFRSAVKTLYEQCSQHHVTCKDEGNVRDFKGRVLNFDANRFDGCCLRQARDRMQGVGLISAGCVACCVKGAC
jgi:hypothetical protein